jgi:transposase
VAFALEGCTGWRYVAEELQRAGVSAHVAEPAETAALKGKKRRAKTDRSDARHLRQLLVDERVPESWIPPAQVLDARVMVRLYKDLLEERTGWFQRVQATLYHHGVPHLAARLVTERGRRHLDEAELPDAGRAAVETGMRQIERLNAEMLPLRRQIALLANSQEGCRALQASHYGIGPLTSAAIWSELGDCRRFSSSDDAVRHAGLDVTVYSSDGKKTRGHLAKQGPPVLRWALYEAAVYAGRPSSPDHAYFASVKKRLDGQLALLSMARKLARRCYHTLRNLGDAAFPAAA